MCFATPIAARHKLGKENKMTERIWQEHDASWEGIRVRDGFDVDLHTLRTHNALAVEREALIAGLVAFIYGGDASWEPNINGRPTPNPQ
jgi:hypothetical protein